MKCDNVCNSPIFVERQHVERASILRLRLFYPRSALILVNQFAYVLDHKLALKEYIIRVNDKLIYHIANQPPKW